MRVCARVRVRATVRVIVRVRVRGKYEGHAHPPTVRRSLFRFPAKKFKVRVIGWGRW